MARVDHEERRGRIAEAVWRLLERGGIEAASVRGVVAETGLSSGSIRHFFSTQLGLHAFAMSSLAGRVEARVAAASQEPDVRQRVLVMIAELMPLRDETERELGIWLAFVARARQEPVLAEILAQQATAVRDFLHVVIGDLVELGWRGPDTDVAAEAAHLNALVDGLTFELLTAPRLITRDQARDVLHAAVFPTDHRER